MEFEWDEDKNKANQRKYQISFEEAAEVFYYPIYEIVDTRFEYGEVRLIGIGRNSQMIILTVVYTEREARIRMISARRANKQEEKLYYEYCTQTD
ncbi:BrnT family toxin [Synechocystis sp. PCC 7509]|uniref:BrnT family toxin n=1 Tax=Synechocystis sp. PCC 7509 TaxID=927677 RepID=UPI000490F7D6|nr:BrnT family toxin [Synechocystis sp. PCC 7509]